MSTQADATPVAADPADARDRRGRRRRSWLLALPPACVVVAVLGYLRRQLVPGLVDGAQRSGAGRRRHRRDGCRAVRREPSPQLAARLDHVAELWPQGLAPLVVVTGGNQPGDRFTEAEASAAYLVERGVPEAAILREDEGTTSYESLRGVADVLGERGLDDVLIVTDPYHALRSRLIAEEVGLQAHVSPTPDSVVTGGSDRPPTGGGRRRRRRPAHRLQQDLTATLPPLRGEWCNWQHSRFWFCY